MQNPSLKWFACALVAVFGFLAGALVLYVSMSNAQATGGSMARGGESSGRYEKLHAKYVYLKKRNEMLHEKLQNQRRAFLAFEKELLAVRKVSPKWRWELFEVEATPCLGIPVLVLERAEADRALCKEAESFAALEERLLGYRGEGGEWADASCENLRRDDRFEHYKERALVSLRAYRSLDRNDSDAVATFWKERINAAMEAFAAQEETDKARLLDLFATVAREANLSEKASASVEEVLAYWRLFYGLEHEKGF